MPLPHNSATAIVRFGVTRAFIADAVFYTRELGPKDLFNLSMAENGSTMSDPELQAHIFGKTNNLTAADITCASDGAVNVIIDDADNVLYGAFPKKRKVAALTATLFG